jgi:uncharacterized Zn-finger protein
LEKTSRQHKKILSKEWRNRDSRNFLLKVNKRKGTSSIVMINSTDNPNIVDSPEERRRRFLEEFEKPFKCEKCNERFKKKKYLREHKSEVHSY